MPSTFTKLLQPLVLAVLACSTPAYARPVAISREVPIAQALASVEASIKGHPNDAAGYNALGRIHALAWAYGDKIPLVSPGTAEALPSFSEFSTVLISRAGRGELMSTETGMTQNDDRKDRPLTPADAAHLTASIAAYGKAIELRSTDAYSELGLAWMLAQQGLYVRELPADYFALTKPSDAQTIAWSQAIKQLADENPATRDAASKALLAAMPQCLLVLRDLKPDDAESAARIDAILHGHFQLQALDHYRKAFDLQAQVDLKNDPSYNADTQISAKAGTQILAILADHPDAAKPGEANAIQQVLIPLAKKLEQLMMMPQ